MGKKKAQEPEPEPEQEQDKIFRKLGENLSVEVSDAEKKYRNRNGPDSVNDIPSHKLKCTVCLKNMSSLRKKGLEPCAHMLLGVLMCEDCASFYGDGCFSSDEDGDDKYCRWCGQGGTLYLCSACTCAFCKKCIRQNLERSVLKDMESDWWKCLICDPKPLFDCRTVCWTLQEHAKKSKEEVDDDSSKTKKNKDESSGSRKRKASEIENDSDIEVSSKRRKDSDSNSVRKSRDHKEKDKPKTDKTTDSSKDENRSPSKRSKSLSADPSKKSKRKEHIEDIVLSNDDSEAGSSDKDKKENAKKKTLRGSSNDPPKTSSSQKYSSMKEKKTKSESKEHIEEVVLSNDDSEADSSDEDKKENAKKKTLRGSSNDSSKTSFSQKNSSMKEKKTRSDCSFTDKQSEIPKKSKEKTPSSTPGKNKKPSSKGKSEPLDTTPVKRSQRTNKKTNYKIDDCDEESNDKDLVENASKTKPKSKEIIAKKTVSLGKNADSKVIEASRCINSALKDVMELTTLISVRCDKLCSKSLQSHVDVLNVFNKMKKLIDGVHTNLNLIEKGLDSKVSWWKGENREKMDLEGSTNTESGSSSKIDYDEEQDKKDVTKATEVDQAKDKRVEDIRTKGAKKEIAGYDSGDKENEQIKCETDPEKSSVEENDMASPNKSDTYAVTSSDRVEDTNKVASSRLGEKDEAMDVESDSTKVENENVVDSTRSEKEDMVVESDLSSIDKISSNTVVESSTTTAEKDNAYIDSNSANADKDKVDEETIAANTKEDRVNVRAHSSKNEENSTDLELDSTVIDKDNIDTKSNSTKYEQSNLDDSIEAKNSSLDDDSNSINADQKGPVESSDVGKTTEEKEDEDAIKHELDKELNGFDDVVWEDSTMWERDETVGDNDENRLVSSTRPEEMDLEGSVNDIKDSSVDDIGDTDDVKNKVEEMDTSIDKTQEDHVERPKKNCTTVIVNAAKEPEIDNVETTSSLETNVETKSLVEPNVETKSLVEPNVENKSLVEPNVETKSSLETNMETKSLVEPNVEIKNLEESSAEQSLAENKDSVPVRKEDSLKNGVDTQDKSPISKYVKDDLNKSSDSTPSVTSKEEKRTPTKSSRPEEHRSSEKTHHSGERHHPHSGDRGRNSYDDRGRWSGDRRDWRGDHRRGGGQYGHYNKARYGDKNYRWGRPY